MSEYGSSLTITDTRGHLVKVNHPAWNDFADIADLWPDINIKVVPNSHSFGQRFSIKDGCIELKVDERQMAEVSVDQAQELLLDKVRYALIWEKNYRKQLAEEAWEEALIPILTGSASIIASGYMSIMDGDPRTGTFEYIIKYLFNGEGPISKLQLLNHRYLQDLRDLFPLRHEWAYGRGVNWLDQNGRELFQ